ncbi:MAG TPA: DUF2306 domain-containing protein [Gemmatimonadaceae bacterium]|nr:DUF2306 domain-containing protein [Gemmatimonadaceae bacterium]
MSTSIGAPIASPVRRVPIWWWFAALLAVGIAAYALRYALIGEPAYVPELSASFRARPLTITVHTLFGPIALVLGLVNLLPAMRQRRQWPAHRWLGRVYLIAAILLGLAGLSLAFHAAGGLGSRIGFVLLAVLTLVTSAQAYRAIRARHVRQHREWMLRSYSLIFAAVTLRIWLPLLIIAYQGQFLPAYRWVAWVSWVPNVLFVEWIIRRGWRPAFVLPASYPGEYEA